MVATEAANATAAAAAAAKDRPRPETRRARVETSTPAPQPPQAEGFVALAIAPWGEVMINGVTRGVSPPLTRLSLAPGLYTIEIRNSAAPPLVARIEIKPGQTLSLQHRF